MPPQQRYSIETSGTVGVEAVGAPCDHPELVVDALDGTVGHPGVEVGEDPRRVLPDGPRELDERRQP